mmetsp:Transcript_28634/g.48104  ORF Transcript_28634/g.48104 Transcript_28634/m.48104 type:complete len:86 (-) Transcript_28634:600-857(-)
MMTKMRKTVTLKRESALGRGSWKQMTMYRLHEEPGRAWVPLLGFCVHWTQRQNQTMKTWFFGEDDICFDCSVCVEQCSAVQRSAV